MLETLGHYKILERIGAGGIGEVYRARDTQLGRTVAIKIVSADIAADPDRRERFLTDAHAAMALSHPNIAALYEIGDEQEHLFLASEFAPGETLNTVIGGRPLNARRAVDLAIQLADALADAHAEGIVHCDLGPDTIIVTPKGNAKILDFGLSAWTDGGLERRAAATMPTTELAPRQARDDLSGSKAGTTPETLGYLSPEQALGERVDHRTDIFSLGIVLFQMLTGRLPFAGSTSTVLTLQIIQAQAPSPSSLNPSLPRDLDPIVARALAKSIDQRYEVAATMAAELRAVAAVLETRAAAAEPIAYVRETPTSRGRSVWWIVVLLAALAAAWFAREPLTRLWHQIVRALQNQG